MVWAWHVKEPSALHSFTSGSGRRHILWTFIDLLRKDARCWTKPACLRGEIKYLYRTGREQKSKALQRPTLCRAFFTDLQASGYLASHTCRMGSVSLPISPDSEYLPAYTGKGCHHNLLSPLKRSLPPTGRSYFSTSFSLLCLAPRQRITMVLGESRPFSTPTFLSFGACSHTQRKSTLRRYLLFICFN